MSDESVWSLDGVSITIDAINATTDASNAENAEFTTYSDLADTDQTLLSSYFTGDSATTDSINAAFANPTNPPLQWLYDVAAAPKPQVKAEDLVGGIFDFYGNYNKTLGQSLTVFNNTVDALVDSGDYYLNDAMDAAAAEQGYSSFNSKLFGVGGLMFGTGVAVADVVNAINSGEDPSSAGIKDGALLGASIGATDLLTDLAIAGLAISLEVVALPAEVTGAIGLGVAVGVGFGLSLIKNNWDSIVSAVESGLAAGLTAAEITAELLDPTHGALGSALNGVMDGSDAAAAKAALDDAVNEAKNVGSALAGDPGGSGGVSKHLHNWARSFGKALHKALDPYFEPLIVNLNGSGLAATTTLANGTFFDNANNGFAQQTAWIGSGSGILVNDPSGGAITNGSQMFGTSTSLSGGGYAVDGFAALADLDSNHDGVINSSDSAWSGLRIWVDSNDNGIVDSGELETMSAAGIASISLTTTATNETDANGNFHGLTATYTKTDSTTGEVDDVSFSVNPTATIPDSVVTVSSDIAALPDINGSGTVTSLQQAMQIQANDSDTTLETYVQDFAAATDDVTRNSLVDEIIYQWTGVAGVSSTARGSYFDARQLEALESLCGFNFSDPYNGTTDPGQQSVAALTAAYQQLHDYVLASLEEQTDLASLLNDVHISVDSGFSNFYDFSAAETAILADLSANRATGLVTLTDFNQALDALNLDQGEGFATFRSDLVVQGADVAATFLDGTSVVYGSAGDDVITAWAGNQTVIATQGGDDTLIGSGDNETFYGSSGDNIFIGGVGNNEVFFSGSKDSTSTGDTFIAGQGTETFREDAYGKATIIYAAGDGNLTINNWITLGDKNVLQLDPSIDESDLGIAVSGNTLVVTDGTSGDQITIDIRSVATLEFADGTTIDLLTTGGTHLATSGATLSGTSHDDIYSYNSGTGHVTLSDTGGANQLWLGSGLTASNLTYTVSGNDLVITDGVSGDQITDLNRGVQTLVFADGSTANLLASGSTYTLSGGATATGTGLNDSYVFASGTGTATISDPGGQNTLLLGSGITAASLTFTASGTDLLITDGVSGDEIDIQGDLGTRTVVGTAKFSDNSTMALTGLALHEASGASVLNGTNGSDTLLGNSGSQTLSGNGGNDIFVIGAGDTTANGGTGNDIYSYASGSGDLTIVETGGLNSIVLGSGITTGDVSFTASGSDLLISDGVSGDQITIKNQLGPQFEVDSLVFADSTTENLEGIALTMPSGVSVLNGTSGDDTLTATSGTQTLIGDGGNDTFVGASGTESLVGDGFAGNNTFITGTGTTTADGGAGNDTFSYASGDGQLTINEEGGQNTLQLGTGISAASLTFTASGHDLLITDGTSGDLITLKNQLTNIQGVQTIEFSDSSTENLEGIALTMPSGASTLYGTAGSDTLTATSGTETINGNGGNDIFITAGGTLTTIGGTGNDIYSYSSGSGHLTIQDNAGTNSIVLGSGISTGSVSLAASGNDLLITDGVSGDQITVKNQLSTQLGITSLVFAGGTTVNLEGLAFTMASGTSVLNGTAGNDTLTATSGTETLIGNGGSNTFVGASGTESLVGTSNGGNNIFIIGTGTTSAWGGGGNDVYSYASGDGHLTITDTVGANSIALGSGITTGDVSFTASGNDLLITDGVSGDQITIKNQLTTGIGVASLIFSGGTTESLEGIALTMPSGASLLNGTWGNDTLTATSGTQTINGNGGNDTFIGGSGTQSLKGNQGTIGNNVFISGTGTTTAWGGTGNDTYSYASGDGLLFVNEGGGTDTLKLASGLTASNVTMNIVPDSFYTDLVISDATTGDEVDIYAFYSFTGSQIETLVYGDGTSTSLVNGVTETATNGTAVLWGTAGNDTLAGGTGTMSLVGNHTAGGNDTMISGIGSTTAWGGIGNDTYSYASGDGHLMVEESGGTDTLKLGSGLTASNVTMAVVADSFYQDLVISDGTTGDQITLYHFGSSTASQIETLVYGDGTSTSLVNNVAETATNGTSTLNGSAGNDTLTATSGTQTIAGNGGSDTFIGGSGTQSLIGNQGTNGNNVFIAGTGSSTAWGGTGNDTYSYAPGDGNFMIRDSGGTDTLRLGVGITSSNISLSESSNGYDLLITDATSGDQVDIYHAQYSSSNAIETIMFSDGSTLQPVLTAAAGNTTLNGTSGNDILAASAGNQTINGNGGSDTFIGGSGTQSLVGNTGTAGNNVFIDGTGTMKAWGGTGNTTYSYASGDGAFWIDDQGGTDTLKLGSGLTAANVTMAVSPDSGYQDLVISDGTTGDQINIYAITYGTGTQQIETIVYGDGTTGSLVSGVTETATNGTTTLWGTAGNDTLIGGTSGTFSLVGNHTAGGNDTMVAGTGTTSAWGGNGNDTYSYASGDGHFWIDDTGGTDTLRLGSGLTAANVTMAVSPDSGYQDLVISDGTSGDQINIYAINYSTGTQQLETIVYGDGTSASLVSGVTETATNGTTTLWGTAGNDTLTGGTSGTFSLVGNHTAGGNDTMIAGIGTTSAWGGSGNDTYSYASGDGSFVINDTGGTDTLKLGTGLTAANVTFSESSNTYDLLITDGTSGDQIDIKNQYYSSSDSVETIVYGDGTTASLTSGLRLTAASGTSTLTGTSGNDTLTGSSGTQTINGNGGSDTFIGGSGTQSLVGNSGSGNNVFVAGTGTSSLWGGTGNTTYSYASGDGHCWIDDQGGTDTLRLGSGLTAANVTMAVAVDGSYQDLVISDGTSGDQINIYAINYGTGTQQLETIIYGDGTSASLVSGVNETATNGTTTLWGTAGNDTLTGGSSGTFSLVGNHIAGGNDTMIAGIGSTTATGGSGNDTYSYASGDGVFYISDTGGTDTLKLGSGLTAANVFFTDTTNGADLIITDGTSGDQITLHNQSTAGDAINQLVFGDGTSLSLSGVVMAASSASTLNGTTGNDILVPSTSNLTIAGKGGNDQYDFGTGMGKDYINNGVSTTNSANGTLFFGHGIADNQLWFDRVDGSGNVSSSGNNLRIDIMGTTTSMTINGWYIGGSSTYEQLSEFQLSDSGLKLDSQLANLVSAMATFETSYAAGHGGTAFDPTAVSSISDTTVLSAVSSDWHS